MNISELSLRRPVLAIVLNIIIVVFGVIGFKFLGVRDYPAIDPPNISVRTSYTGANADIIETQITEPLEKAINGIAGIKNITSTSSNGTSNIMMCGTKYHKLYVPFLPIWKHRLWYQKRMQAPTLFFQ
jgi:multidrug efflux pump